MSFKSQAVWLFFACLLLNAFPLWGSDAHRVMIMLGKKTSEEHRDVLLQLKTNISSRMESLPYIQEVADTEERELLQNRLEHILSDLYSEDGQVELGNWKGEQKLLVLNIYESRDPEGLLYQVIILDLETGYKTNLTYLSKDRETALAARRLTHKIKARLAPTGEITEWVSKYKKQVRINIGQRFGLSKGMKLTKKDGKTISARLKVIKVRSEDVVAEIESGSSNIQLGDQLHVELDDIPVGEGWQLEVVAPKALNNSNVYVDGKLKGKLVSGRIEMRLWQDEHELEIRGPKPFREVFYLEDDHQIYIPLLGELKVQSLSGATVKVMGENDETWRELGEEGQVFELQSGSYGIKVEKFGFLPGETKKYIQAGEMTTIDLKLKPIIEMVLVKAGEFEMGALGETGSPLHPVYLDSFYIDQYEVRVTDFQSVFTHYTPPDNYPAKGPAIGISWNEAREYCKEIGKRLPTEAEWEKACRGPEGFRYGYGDFFDQKRTDARTAENRIASHPLTGSNVNGFDVYDMTGGVLEWSADVYLGDMSNLDYRNPVSEGRVGNYVARGGAYMMSDPAKKASCVFRYDINVNLEDVRNSTLGFRCASDAD